MGLYVNATCGGHATGWDLVGSCGSPGGGPRATIEPSNIAVFDNAGNQTQYFPGQAQTYITGVPSYAVTTGDTTTQKATIEVR